jgi:hypothetical protein
VKVSKCEEGIGRMEAYWHVLMLECIPRSRYSSLRSSPEDVHPKR